MDISEIFAPDMGKKRNNNLEIASLLRILAKLLDEKEETDTNIDEDRDAEVETRPHFMPSGGP